MRIHGKFLILNQLVGIERGGLEEAEPLPKQILVNRNERVIAQHCPNAEREGVFSDMLLGWMMKKQRIRDVSRLI